MATCPVCTKSFVSRGNPGGGARKIYCSELCRRRRHRPNYMPGCRSCGRHFDRMGRPAIYCSSACQASAQDVQAECTACGKTFETTIHGGRKTCSEGCARALISAGGKRAARVPRRTRPCAGCSIPVSCSGKVALCAGCATERQRARWRRKGAVRRRGAVAVGEPMSVEQLGERDGWRCHLCHRKVKAGLHYLDPGAATFDHLIPVADGGVDAPENLRLAHRRCNTRRGTGGAVQLLLVG